MSEPWTSWSLDRWNAALFTHVFSAGASDSPPVVRIPVTPEFLARSLGTGHDAAHEVRASFVSLFQLPPAEFNRLFDLTRACQFWSEGGIPPFFAQLVFTLLIASACSDTIGEGNFRRRIEKELRHPPNTLYPLRDLPAMWRLVEAWLQRSRKGASSTYRELILPDVGRRDTLIGYSKCLAFPCHRDYQALTQLLADRDLDSSSPPALLVAAVRAARFRFTRPFLEELEDFDDGFRRQAMGLREHPFWAAVRSISWEFDASGACETSRPRSRLHLGLSTGYDPVVSLLSDTRSGSLDGLVGEDLAVPISGLRYFFRCPGNEKLGLLERLELVPSSRSHLRQAIIDECVCFAEDEVGECISWPNLPSAGSVYLLVRGRRAARLSIFLESEEKRPLVRDTSERNWHLVGPLDVGVADRFGRSLVGTVDEIRSLCPRLVDPALYLRGACRTDGAFLMRPGVWPIASCPGAERVVCIIGDEPDVWVGEMTPSGTECDGRSFRLTRSCVGLDTRLPGEVHFLALRGEVVVARRRLYACTSVSSTSYKLRANDDAWLVEGATGDLVGLDASGGLEQPPSICFPLGQSIRAWPVLREPGPTGLELSRQSLADLRQGWADLLESIAGISLSRQGLSEVELIELVQNCLGPNPPSVVWDVIRALVENWVLDCCSFRRWSGRRYFARRPQVVTGNGGSVRIIGLLPERARSTVVRMCTEHSVYPLLSNDARINTVGSTILLASSSDFAEKVAHAIDAELTAFDTLRPPELAPLRHLAVRASLEAGWRPEVRDRFWSWTAGAFQPHESISDVGVQLVRRDYQDRQAEFLLSCGGSTWLTRSRTWALLLANSLAGSPSFGMFEDGTIVRHAQARVYLPLPIARTLSLLGLASGPLDGEDGRSVFVYMTGDAEMTESLISPLLHPLQEARAPTALARWRARSSNRRPWGPPAKAACSRSGFRGVQP